MKKKIIGNNTLIPSQISFGGAPLGELFENLTEENCNKTLNKCFELGIKLFDTSPFYGYGLSEKRIGDYLKTKNRNSFIICTKVGRYLVPEQSENIDRGIFKGGLNFKPVIDYSYDGTMKSFEQSLKRLRLTEIDIALIHDVDFFTHGDLTEVYFKISMEGAYKALHKLKEQNLIKAIGVGLNDATMCTRFAHAGNFDCMMLANRYTLLEQKALNNFFPIAKDKNISVLLAGVYNSGILIKGLKKDVTYEYAPLTAEIKSKYLEIQKICNEFKIPIAAAALQFANAPEVVSTLVLGMDKPFQVKKNNDLLKVSIDKDFWNMLKRKKLINENSPTPS